MTNNPEQYVNADVWAKIKHIDDNYHKGRIVSIYTPEENKSYYAVWFKQEQVASYFPMNSFDDGYLYLFDPTKHISGDDAT